MKDLKRMRKGSEVALLWASDKEAELGRGAILASVERGFSRPTYHGSI